MKLQPKLMLSMAATALLAVLVSMVIALTLGSRVADHEVKERIRAVLDGRHSALAEYLARVQRDGRLLEADPETAEALRAFSQAFSQRGEKAQAQLQQAWVVGNPHPPGERARLVASGDGSPYDRAHARYHPNLREKVLVRAWQDLVLVDPKGNVVYSTQKESDFATNLRTGPWRNTGLAAIVLPLLDKPDAGVPSFADLADYPPSGRPARFYAVPIFHPVDGLLGVVAIQMSIDRINRLLQQREGLGESGETFIVSRDGWMLSDSRFEKESTILRKQLRTAAVDRVLKGESGLIDGVDYRGVRSFIGFKPIQAFPDAIGGNLRWGVIAKVDYDEAMASIANLRNILLLVGGLVALLAVAAGIQLARTMSRPILAIKDALVRLAQGVETAVPGLERSDEIGAMAQATETFREQVRKTEHEHWIQENVASLTAIVSGESSMQHAPEHMLRHLCEILNVPVAAFYLDDGEGKYQRLGTHGLARRSQSENGFRTGEGVLGQCAKDGEAIVLSPVPSGLAIISSGLVEFPPEELVLYPLPHKNRVLAVLELATIRKLEPIQHEFLKAACDALGLHFANLQVSEHNLALLTETRQKSEELHASAHYARSLIEASLDPLVTISAEGKITDVNTATEKVTGVTRDTLIGSDFADYFTEPERAREGYREVFSQGFVTDYSLAIRHVSGRIIDVLYNASVYRDVSGNVIGAFAAARDVTERKRAQEATQAAAQYSRSLIEASLDPLVTINAEGKITDVNTATEKITGVARNQLIGSDFANYFTEPEQARAGYLQVFTQGFVMDYPLAIRHSSGSVADVLYNASVYRDTTGKVLGVFAAARDITARKKAEAALKEQQEALLRNNEEMRALNEELKAQTEELKAGQEELRAQQEEMSHKNQSLEAQGRQLELARQESELRAEELREASQYKSEFLANMSHELRTPLNSILILAKSLADNAEKNLTLDQTESAAVIHESGTHLLTLINDILDLSKIEAGRFEILNEDFPLSEVMSYLRRIFAPLAEKKGIEFAIDVNSEVPENLHGDRQRTTQVLTNLLSNAVKFTEQGRVEIEVGQKVEGIEINIRDTGIGIPEDKLDHIFGVFQQVDGTTSRKYGGSGLGLAISKRLVELMGGEISVISAVGEGSCFSVRLPLKASDSQQALQRPQAAVVRHPVARQTSGRRKSDSVATAGSAFLVVEDDSRLVAILGKLIDTLGYPVMCVDSGEKALEFVLRERPAGILLDLGLPGISGMEVLRRIKTDPMTSDIPVFIMSGAVDTGEAKTLGAGGFLKKPVTKDVIAHALLEMSQKATAHHAKKVLLVEDDNATVTALKKLFKHDPLELVPVASGREAMALLENNRFHAVILDLSLEDMSGFEWLQKCVEANRHLPHVVVYSARELTKEELITLGDFTETVVTKGRHANERLHEEVLLALDAPMTHTDEPVVVNESLAGRRLLLVDDDVRNLFALSRVLKARGFVVSVAEDGMKALEVLRSNHFDAVLTDIMMPGIDGYELTRRIRKQGYTDLPVIAVTAKAMQGDQELCLAAGANAYISKPVDAEGLIALLREYL